jgi:STI1/HOP, DP domain
MFKDPDLFAEIALNPRTKRLAEDPNFKKKLELLVQGDSKILQTEIMGDQRLMSVLSMLLKKNMSTMGRVRPNPSVRY